MVARVVVGVSWSLVTGLGGGWLLLSPWALGVQPSSGDWTNVTKTQFWTGAGLVALAVVGLIVVVAQVASMLRGVPEAATAVARPRGGPAAAPTGSGEMDAALVALANALVADLNRQPAARPAPAGGPYHQPPPPGPPAPAAPPAPPVSHGPSAPPSNGPPATQVPQPPPAGGDPWRTR